MDSNVRKRKPAAYSGRKRHHPEHHHHHHHELSMDGHISCLSWMLLLAVFYLSLVSMNILINNHMPTSKTIATSKPEEFTEERARQHLDSFVKLGARTAGTYVNDVQASNYIQKIVSDIKLSAKTNKQIEVDVQYPTGSFYLPHLDHFVSYYSNITNTVVRVTSPESDENALLLNCHTDSVMNAPGASDDAVACSVLLEIMRAIVADKTPLLHPLIFLFNGAEENILQAAHGFITQHKWVNQIKAFINLEAAGAGGKEFLFQTGPEHPWIVWAWAKHAPYPHGTSVGQDLFQSGIIPSDTDFRIFRDHGHIPGIDLAYIKNGYVYHTLHDTPAMIPPGCVQRAGDNIYEMVRHLVLSSESLLPDPSEYRHGAVAYFDVFGIHMVVIPMRLLTIINFATIFAVLAYIGRRMLHSEITGYSSFEYSSKLVKAVAVNILGYTACFLGLSLLGAFMTKTGRSLSWYAQPALAFGLYVPAGLLGLVTVHCVAKMLLFKKEDSRKVESLFFDATLVMWVSIVFQAVHVSSSYLFAFPTLFAIVGRGYIGKGAFSNKSSAPGINRVILHLGVLLIPMAVLVNKLHIMTMVFMALTGRSGSEVPPEIFAFTLIGLCIFACFSYQICTVYLVNSLKLFYLVMITCLACSLAFAFTKYGFPFDNDPLSPANKRLYMQHVKREFFNHDGTLEKQDSGMLVPQLDYVGLRYDLGSETLMKAPVRECEGPYGEMPYIMPLAKLVKKYQYAPVPPPSKLVTTDQYQFKVEWQKKSTPAGNRARYVHLDVTIHGPPTMALYITPTTPGSLVEWSFDHAVNGTNSKHTEKETFFVFYGAGYKHPPWKLWLRFSVTAPESDRVVQLAASGHYRPSGPVSRINKQTPELEKITSELHEWIAPMTWVSLYKNYII